MKVYIVWHEDMEDDRYVRAVCLNKDIATTIANSPEIEPPQSNGHRYVHDHFTFGGTKESMCCRVETYEVIERAVPFDIDGINVMREKLRTYD